MRLTVFILLLPVIIFFSGFLMASRIDGPAVIVFLVIWMLASIACFVRGLFIFDSHRRLAWCCFLVALLQFSLAIVPAFYAPHRSFVGAAWPNTYQIAANRCRQRGMAHPVPLRGSR